MASMDLRRVAPPLVAALFVGGLVATLFLHRDAEPRPDPDAVPKDGTREALDPYAASGEDKRLTGEQDPARALPAGHPPVEPTSDRTPPPGDPHGGAARPGAGDAPDAGRGPTLPFAHEAPASWTSEAPSSSMRVAQWTLAPEPGTSDGGQVVVFGNIGGSVAANVERWEKEFGGARALTRERKDGALTVTRVAIEGTFSGGMAARGAGPKSGWRLLGAVVETPSGTYFVKGTGPAAVMAREEAAFDAFLASIRLRG
jgi:hypothetical protein